MLLAEATCAVGVAVFLLTGSDVEVPGFPAPELRFFPNPGFKFTATPLPFGGFASPIRCFTSRRFFASFVVGCAAARRFARLVRAAHSCSLSDMSTILRFLFSAHLTFARASRECKTQRSLSRIDEPVWFEVEP